MAKPEVKETQLLSGEIAPGWKIIEPLLVTIEQDEDGSYVVSEDLFAVYGVGDTPSDALRDYTVSLTDYYDLVSAQAKGDGPTQSLFHRLQQYVQKAIE